MIRAAMVRMCALLFAALILLAPIQAASNTRLPDGAGVQSWEKPLMQPGERTLIAEGLYRSRQWNLWRRNRHAEHL